jgi:hypothetical protein
VVPSTASVNIIGMQPCNYNCCFFLYASFQLVIHNPSKLGSLPDGCLGSVFRKLVCPDKFLLSGLQEMEMCGFEVKKPPCLACSFRDLHPCLLSLKGSRKLLDIDDAAIYRIPIFLSFFTEHVYRKTVIILGGCLIY